MPRYPVLPIAVFTLLGLAHGWADEVSREPRRHPDDPAAREFLRRVEERDNQWNGFPGFSAYISVYREGKTHGGELVVRPNRKIDLVIAEEVAEWVERTLQPMVFSSTRKPFDERYGGIGVVFGRDDLSPFGQLVELRGDPYKTRFRVKDNELWLIERTTPEHRISIHLLDVIRDEDGRKISQSFVVYYRDKESGELLRSEAIRDEHVIVGDYVLPLQWYETEVGREGNVYRTITLSEHKLLPAKSKPREDLADAAANE